MKSSQQCIRVTYVLQSPYPTIELDDISADYESTGGSIYNPSIHSENDIDITMQDEDIYAKPWRQRSESPDSDPYSAHSTGYPYTAGNEMNREDRQIRMSVWRPAASVHLE